MIWFIIYYVFAGLFSIGYTPMYPTMYPTDSFRTRIIVDVLIFLFGFLIFPVIMGGAFRIWLSKKK